MTYGRAHRASHALVLDGAAVSHPAELMRGNLSMRIRPLHPFLRTTFSPRGEGTSALVREKECD